MARAQQALTAAVLFLLFTGKLLFAFIAVVIRPVGVDIQAYTGLGVIAVAMMLQLKFSPHVLRGVY